VGCTQSTRDFDDQINISTYIMVLRTRVFEKFKFAAYCPLRFIDTMWFFLCVVWFSFSKTCCLILLVPKKHIVYARHGPSKCTKSVGGRGFAPDPTGGAYSAPPDPLAVNGRGGIADGRRRRRKGKKREGKEKGAEKRTGIRG
jgi:hypothetical protein